LIKALRNDVGTVNPYKCDLTRRIEFESATTSEAKADRVPKARAVLPEPSSDIGQGRADARAATIGFVT
jgi:hypothetical protein